MRGLLFFLFWCVNSSVWAACTGGVGEIYPPFNMGTHYVPRDAAIGSVIGTANVAFSVAVGRIDCPAGEEFRVAESWPVVTGLNLPQIPGVNRDSATVIRTNVPGVGLLITVPSFPGYTSANWEASEGNLPLVPFRLLSRNTLYISGSIPTNFTLIKVSDEIPMGSSAIVNTTSAVQFYIGGRRRHSIFLTGTVIRSECSLAGGANTYIEVPMGDVMRSKFGGKNSHTDSKNVVIPLTNCTAGTYPAGQGWNFYTSSFAHLRLDGAQGSRILDAAQGILGLTQDSTAKGVAVQVLRNDGVTPLTLGTEVPIDRTSNGNLNLQLKARYIQTVDSARGPQPGKADARAAFTVTYK